MDLDLKSSRFYRDYYAPKKYKVIINLMEQGKIARLMDKGYGFISRDGEEKDLFFHANELQGVEFNDLREGDEVEFEATEGPKGPQASNVQKTS